ncbi:cobalamin B12-binding domain-containing protein [Candidatus Poribacteria bacterium]|nr:cobalamin B12-binding domain-containing protein [Candidatus Poribacteria bacterium]
MAAVHRILLVVPPFPAAERYGKGIKDLAVTMPPMGLLYVAAYLEKHGYEVSILDCELEGLNLANAIGKIKEARPDLVGMTCLTPNFRRCNALTSSIKKEIGVPVVYGGAHPTLLPEGTLRNSEVDYIVIGEGEVTFLELLNALNHDASPARLSEIDGLAYRENGDIKVNPDRQVIQDINALPLPARHLIRLERYRPGPQHYKELPFTTMITSRGCPYRCIFCCTNKIWKRRYRQRTVPNVIEEIKFLQKEYGIREIGFWDDLWGLKDKWIIEFCDTVEREHLKFSWSCELRVDTADFSILQRMKRAGCWCIFYGAESLHQELLNNIQKDVKVEDIITTLQNTKKAGIEIRANFILGLPGETPEMARNMIKMVNEMDPDYVKYNIFTPLPGSRSYEMATSGEWGEFTADYDRLTGYFPTFRPFGYESLDQLHEMRQAAHKSFYFRPRYILRKLRSIDNWSRLRSYTKAALAIMKS